MRFYCHLQSMVILFGLLNLIFVVHGIAIVNQSNLITPQNISSTSSSSHTCSKIRTNCSTQDGLIIPLWRPQDGISIGDRISRAIVYLLALIYLFMGVAIISDRFMASIEVITSQKREIRKKNPDGTVSVTTVAIWNETVSNLTLMALGSSAPEILLSIIEVVGKNFKSGDLGPGTIVGSAAFNLFVIIAICILAIPSGEVRRIRHQRVFFVTTAWSIFAYIWLWAIVAKISPGYIEVWEGTLTFLFFPLTVLSAYIVDTKVGQFIRIRITSQKQVLQTDNHTSAIMPINIDSSDVTKENQKKNIKNDTTKNTISLSNSDLQAKKSNSMHKSVSGGLFDQIGSSNSSGGGVVDESMFLDQNESQKREEFIDIWRQLRQQYPNHDMHTLNDMAAVEMMNRVPKSRGKTKEIISLMDY
jgi:solute carrier family 8 (sodium/calcium exchanger)